MSKPYYGLILRSDWLRTGVLEHNICQTILWFGQTMLWFGQTMLWFGQTMLWFGHKTKTTEVFGHSRERDWKFDYIFDFINIYTYIYI